MKFVYPDFFGAPQKTEILVFLLRGFGLLFKLKNVKKINLFSLCVKADKRYFVGIVYEKSVRTSRGRC